MGDTSNSAFIHLSKLSIYCCAEIMENHFPLLQVCENDIVICALLTLDSLS